MLTDLCENLAEKFDVHVVCGQPNSPSTNSFVPVGTQQRNSVTIHRLKHTAFAKRVPAGRLVNLLSFTRAAERYLRQCSLEPDVVICETDPFLLPMVASRFKRRTGAKLICYLQDIYPDVAVAIGKVKPGCITNQIRKRLQVSYSTADLVIVLGECMKSRLANEPWALDPESITVIPNWADCDAITPLPRESNPFRLSEGLQDKFLVMHSGNMGLTQRLDVLVKATQSTYWPSSAVLLLVGDGAAKSELVRQANAGDSQRIRFLPYQPREALSQSLSAADLHVVSMHENIAGCLCPSKLYGILAAGRAVLAITSEATDLYRVVKNHGLGWCCVPGDSDEIAKTVAEASSCSDRLNQASQEARRVACQRYDRRVAHKDFATLLSAVIKPGEACGVGVVDG